MHRLTVLMVVLTALLIAAGVAACLAEANQRAIYRRLP